MLFIDLYCFLSSKSLAGLSVFSYVCVWMSVSWLSQHGGDLPNSDVHHLSQVIPYTNQLSSWNLREQTAHHKMYCIHTYQYQMVYPKILYPFTLEWCHIPTCKSCTKAHPYTDVPPFIDQILDTSQTLNFTPEQYTISQTWLGDLQNYVFFLSRHQSEHLLEFGFISLSSLLLSIAECTLPVCHLPPTINYCLQ